MGKNLTKKIALVEDVSRKLSAAKSAVLVDYRGLSVAQISQLRSKIADQEAQFQVIKNTLLKRALQLAGYDNEQSYQPFLTGPTASIFCFGDEIAAIKELNNFIQINDLPKIKGGFLGKRFLSAEQVEKLAKLPTKQVLLAQTVTTIASPISALTFVLQANLRNLVLVLNQIATKGKGENIKN